MQRLIPLFLAALFGHSLVAQPYGDCATAMEICKKQLYKINETGGEGADRQEADFIACFYGGQNNGQAEENSTWLKFEIAQSGSLIFSITPHQDYNDIDFVVFKLPPSGDCRYKQIVRCMASGDPEYLAAQSPCLGKTGLREGEKDSSEDPGCGDLDDNAWLAPLKVEKGEKYVLLVSNVSEAGPGFDITFGGSAKLPCEEEKKLADKPKEKPKVKPAEPKPVPPAPPALTAKSPGQPEVIGGRTVEVDETLKVKNRTIKVKIWDSQVEDGDIVSVFLDDKKVVDHLYLRLSPQEFEIQLPDGKEHFLTVYADDFGKAEPNTAMISVNDGTREQIIDLVAGRKKQESVKIISE